MGQEADALFKTGYLQSGDHTPLFYRQYGVKDKKASVLLVHGLGEHGGRYAHVVERLRREGFEVLSLDLRGHGLSKGRRGDVESFSKYEEDVLAGAKLSLAQRAGKKFFIVAHSMGALAVLGMVSKNAIPVDGLVLSCPLFQAKIRIPLYKRALAASLSRTCPKLMVGSEIKGSQLSSDPKMAKAYDDDQLVLKKVSLRAYREITKGCENSKNIPTQKAPLLMQVAGRDPLVDPKATEHWFDEHERKSKDATLKYYPEFLHEIYNEADRDKAIDDFVSWLNERAA